MNPILVWLLCSLSAIGGFTLAALLVADSQTDQRDDYLTGFIDGIHTRKGDPDERP